jgi:hypothetical protein
MERVNAGRAILAGFVATVAMTIMMYAGLMMGMPKMDIAATLGSVMSGGMPAPGSGGWWMGMLVHFVNGTIIFALIYASGLAGALPGALWLRGATWGVILWAVAQAVVMPMMGMGFLSAKAPQPMLG